MSRDEKIRHLIHLINETEGAFVPLSHFDEMTEEEIDEKIEFREYVLDK